MFASKNNPININTMKNIDNLLKNIQTFSNELESLKTEYKNNEKNIFHAIVDNSQHTIMVIQNNTIKYINPSGYSMLGYDFAASVTGKDILSLIHEHDEMQLFEYLAQERPIKKGPFELRYVKNNKAVVYTETVLVPFLYKKRMATLLFSNDITHHKNNLHRISKSEERLRMIFENAPLGIYQTTPGGKFIDVNPTLAKMLGFSSAHETVETIKDIGKEIYLRQSERHKIIKNTILENNIYKYETVLKKQDGKHFIANIYCRPVKDEHGNPKYLEGMVEDITQQKNAKAALKASEKKYRLLYHNAPLPYQSLDQDKKIIDVNPAWLNALGYKQEEVIGKPFFNFLHPDYKNNFKEKCDEFNETGKAMNTIFPIKKANAAYILVSFTGIVDYDINNNTSCYYCVFRDITEEKRKEKQNKQMVADALYINQKNKILEEINETLNNICARNKTISTKDLSPVFELISNNIKADKDWLLLKNHFEALHKDFFNNIINKHPDLTQNDLRHCACIKMNFSTKEIARMNNVKPTTIQNSRVRLKKKLGLSGSVDLRQYILGF
jgi:PAS domain S-box-containing protein